MIEVTIGEGDRIEWALKAFKRQVLRAGILREVRRRQHYTKPSEARALKSQAARRRSRSKSRGPARG
jgi:small subunit ribosomal protein S21